MAEQDALLEDVKKKVSEVKSLGDTNVNQSPRTRERGNEKKALDGQYQDLD